MQRKVFIAINLDEKTKQYIEKKLSTLTKELEGKWVPSENYHITILHVGFIDDQGLVLCCNDLRNSLSKIKGFEIEFDSIGWGPSEKKKKMIWIKGKENKKLIELRGIVEKVIHNSDLEHKKFRPHITCARISKRSAEGSCEGLLHGSRSELLFTVSVLTLDVMESVYENGKRTYKPLDIIELS